MFKAAVIAVPIAGGLILVILILMAVRMLREDYRRSDSHNRFLKAHNFIDQHFVKKEERKCKSKKYSYNSVRDSNQPVPVHHHHTYLSSQLLKTKDSQHAGDNSLVTQSTPNVCVSLLPASKQSDFSPV